MATKNAKYAFSLTHFDTTVDQLDAAESSNCDVHRNDAPHERFASGQLGELQHESNDPADDRFALTRLHASGGIGQIWLAHDAQLDRCVALKELRPELADDPIAAARFDREAKITGQLEHPGIVPIYELGQRTDTRQPFYTMRFIKGRTFSEAARAYHEKRNAGEAEPVDLLQLLNAFVAVCNSLAYAHSRGVIHRDLKGANVILGDFGEAIVVDWGLAKLSEGPDEHAETPVALGQMESEPWNGTVAGHVIGTPSYMSPEQAAGRTELMDHRTDVYGLGTILYEILTGLPPFSGHNLQDVVRQVQNDPPVSPREICPGIPQELEAICLRALAKHPSDRYASAAELSEEIQNLLAELAEEPLRRMAASKRQAQRALRKAHDQQRALIELIRSQAFQSQDLAQTFRLLTEVAARTLKVERVGIWRYNLNRSAIDCADLYERGADRHSSGTELKAAAYPAYFQALASSEVIAAHDARSDPRTREFTVGYLNVLGISSMLDAPTHLFGKLDGVLCHEHVGRPREWTAEEQLFGIALSNLVSLAIEQWERRCAVAESLGTRAK